MDEYKESEASKLIKRLMDEEGFTFGEAVQEAMRQEKEFESKADGGAIGIEVLFKEKMKDGGRIGFDKGGAYMDVPYSLFVKAERAVENEEINPRTGDPYDNVDQYIEAYLKGYKEEDFKYKTGGRAGFFMGGPALEGQALSIYNSMKGYGATDQAIADRLATMGLYTPGGSTPDTPDQGIINQQLQTGRDDNRTGFGKFGNLDPTTERTFVKDVYTIDKNMYPGAPMTGSFKPTEVTGYKNVNTGQYQTLEGKNINHGGIPLKPVLGAIFEGLGFGGIDETKLTGLPYKEGQIAGTFTGKKLSNFNPFNLFKKQQATIAEINAMNQKAIKDMEAKERAKEAAARRELENRIISGGANISGGGDGGGGNITTSAGTFAPGDYSDVAGTLADPREKMDYYRDGGLATMFTRRR